MSIHNGLCAKWNQGNKTKKKTIENNNETQINCFDYGKSKHLFQTATHSLMHHYVLTLTWVSNEAQN